jgi:hypothetical protein
MEQRSDAAESRGQQDGRTAFERFVEAAQERLNVLAEALPDVMESQAQHDPTLTASVRKLRDAVGLEARH